MPRHLLRRRAAGQLRALAPPRVVIPDSHRKRVKPLQLGRPDQEHTQPLRVNAWVSPLKCHSEMRSELSMTALPVQRRRLCRRLCRTARILSGDTSGNRRHDRHHQRGNIHGSQP